MEDQAASSPQGDLAARSDLVSEIGTEPNRLIASTSPLRDTRIDIEVPTGLTITEMLDLVELRPALRPLAHVWLCDREMKLDPVFIDEKDWHRVRPRPGIVVTLRVAPQKGGSGGKSSMGLIARIAVIALQVAASFIPFVGPVVAFAIPIPGRLIIASTLERKTS